MDRRSEKKSWRGNMKKLSAIICLAAFMLFFTVTSYAGLDTADFSLSQRNAGFSLAQTYEVVAPSLELNRAELRNALINSQDERRAESLKAEIQHLKKRRTTSLLVSIGLAGLGSFFLYEFINYVQPVRESQEGGTQDVEEGRSNTSMGKGIRLAGFAASYVVSIVLITDVAKKSKAIKQYKQELQELSRAQGR